MGDEVHYSTAGVTYVVPYVGDVVRKRPTFITESRPGLCGTIRQVFPNVEKDMHTQGMLDHLFMSGLVKPQRGKSQELLFGTLELLERGDYGMQLGERYVLPMTTVRVCDSSHRRYDRELMVDSVFLSRRGLAYEFTDVGVQSELDELDFARDERIARYAKGEQTSKLQGVFGSIVPIGTSRADARLIVASLIAINEQNYGAQRVQLAIKLHGKILADQTEPCR